MIACGHDNSCAAWSSQWTNSGTIQTIIQMYDVLSAVTNGYHCCCILPRQSPLQERVPSSRLTNTKDSHANFPGDSTLSSCHRPSKQSPEKPQPLTYTDVNRHTNTVVSVISGTILIPCLPHKRTCIFEGDNYKEVTSPSDWTIKENVAMAISELLVGPRLRTVGTCSCFDLFQTRVLDCRQRPVYLPEGDRIEHDVVNDSSTTQISL